MSTVGAHNCGFEMLEHRGSRKQMKQAKGRRRKANCWRALRRCQTYSHREMAAQHAYRFPSPMWCVSYLREGHHRASCTKRELGGRPWSLSCIQSHAESFVTFQGLNVFSVCNIVPWIHLKCDLNLVRHYGAVPSSLNTSKHLWPVVFVKGFGLGSWFWVLCPLWCGRYGRQEEGEAGHIVATVRKQRAMDDCMRSAYFLLLIQPGEPRTKSNIIHL